MLYALAVLTRWFCPPKRDKGGAVAEERASGRSYSVGELTETKPEPSTEPSTPIPPPSSPVIASVATPTYPDLPTLNPSIVQQTPLEKDDDTYTV